MAISQPQGDLARVINHESNSEWPTMIEMVAYFGKDRKGKSKRIAISADQFFGRKTNSHPIPSIIKGCS